MKILSHPLPRTPRVMLPQNRPAEEPPKDVQVPAQPSKSQTFGKQALKGVAGAVVGFAPGAAAGYGISTLGGVAGGVIGGLTGAALGFFSGHSVHKLAQKMAKDDPSKLSWIQKGALYCGAAAPYLWSLAGCVGGAVAGSHFAPGVNALLFGKKTMIASGLFFGSKTPH